MAKKIDRIGEIRTNNFGSKMMIVEYRKYSDIDIYFPEYNWMAKNKQYGDFKKGEIKCPYERRAFKIGYIGEGKYKTKENGKYTKVYKTWKSMLTRCYDSKFHKKEPIYIGCETSDEFLNFQNFGIWDEDNYYKVGNEKMCLDKDILVKHNKIYSPDTCIYVPERINLLFVKNNNRRGDNPIGVSDTKNGKYQVFCNLFNSEVGKSKYEYLGRYNTQEEAFEVYKYYKEKNIKEVADYYKKQIPEILYGTLYNYEVEIDD